MGEAEINFIESFRYRDNVRARSLLLRDQNIPPLEKAVYWVEHVIKHKGAIHLKSEAQNLKWHEVLLLDVAAFFIFTIFLFCFIVKLIFQLIFNKISLQSKRKLKRKKN